MSSDQLVELAQGRIEGLKEAIRKLENRVTELEKAEIEAYPPKLRAMHRSLQANQVPPEMHQALVVAYFRSLLES